MTYDYCIIGGGIVGVATAYTLGLRYPEKKILVLEKENDLARHQSGKNSGVIHAGVYYAPGSLKAQLCRKGAHMIKDFCAANDILVDNCGKLIVATDEIERTRLGGLQERCEKNGIPFEPVTRDNLKKREPYISGIEALFFPESSVVDYAVVTHKLAEYIRKNGGEICLGASVTAIVEEPDGVTVRTSKADYRARQLIVCGGAQSDRLARMAGLDIDFRVVPFRGEYYVLDPKLNDKVTHLIYPVPDPNLPFLGIHLTKVIGGGMTVGPNAVLGFSREGSPQFSVNVRDVFSFLTHGGFWAFLAGNWKTGITEFRNSLSKRRYLKECQKYMPSLELSDLTLRQAGVRAQIILPNGEAAQDFVTRKTARMYHVCNAPSPAATSSLAIAEMIVEDIEGKNT